jgi:regulatory protein
MKRSYERQNLIEATINFVSFRLRSSAEIMAYLAKTAKRHDLTPDDITAAYERLSELGYIDDRKFADAFVASRLASHPKGKRVLLMELHAKGIAADLAAEVIERSFAGGSTGESVSERELAEQALGRRLDLWRKLPKLERQKKIYGFLLRRGFGTDTVRSIVDAMDRND